MFPAWSEMADALSAPAAVPSGAATTLSDSIMACDVANESRASVSITHARVVADEASLAAPAPRSVVIIIGTRRRSTASPRRRRACASGSREDERARASIDRVASHLIAHARPNSTSPSFQTPPSDAHLRRDATRRDRARDEMRQTTTRRARVDVHAGRRTKKPPPSIVPRDVSDMSAQPSTAWSVARVCAGVACWEGQFQISRWLIARKLPETSEKERSYKHAVSSYVVSFVHAFFLTWAGWSIVFRLKDASMPERLSLYANKDEGFVGFVEVVTIAFFSYVVYDLLHVLEQYPNLGGVDILVHHFGFFTASLLAYAYGAYPYMLGWLCTCETSTPLLNLRFFIKSWREMDRTLPYIDSLAKTLGMKTRGVTAGNWLEYYVSVAFFWVFIAVRLLGYGSALVALTIDLRSVEDNFIPWVVRAILYVLTCCGLLLNCAWAYKIHGMVRHFRQKVLKLRDEGEVSDSDDSSSEKHS